jgi:hypothetical protein
MAVIGFFPVSRLNQCPLDFFSAPSATATELRRQLSNVSDKVPLPPVLCEGPARAQFRAQAARFRGKFFWTARGEPRTTARRAWQKPRFRERRKRRVFNGSNKRDCSGQKDLISSQRRCHGAPVDVQFLRDLSA